MAVFVDLRAAFVGQGGISKEEEKERGKGRFG